MIRKKAFAIVLVSLLLLSMTVPAGASSTYGGNREELIDVLKTYGFPEDFLAKRGEQDLIALSEEFELGNVSLCDIKTQALYVTGENTDDGIMPAGIMPSADMTLSIVTLAQRVTGSTTKLSKLIVKIYYDWADGHPFTFLKDSIAVNWDASAFSYIPSSFSHTDYRSGNIVLRSFYSPAISNQGGLGYHADLTAGYMSQSGSTRFELAPNNTPMYIAESNEAHSTMSVNANYAHRTSLANITLGYAGLGVSMNTSASDEVSSSALFLYKYCL